MTVLEQVTHTPLATLDVDGREVRVTLHTASDGMEYIGRLFFADAEWSNNGIPDRSVIADRSPEEVLERARRLNREELLQRHRRANVEKRRYHSLRRVTAEFLGKVRYLNRVAVGMRSGLLDAAAGQHELEMTEQEMMAIVERMKHAAGIEG